MRPREAPHYADHVVRPRLHAFKYNHTPSITLTLPNNAPTLFGFLDDISAGYPRWNIHQTAIGSGNAGATRDIVDPQPRTGWATNHVAMAHFGNGLLAGEVSIAGATTTISRTFPEQFAAIGGGPANLSIFCVGWYNKNHWTHRPLHIRDLTLRYIRNSGYHLHPPVAVAAGASANVKVGWVEDDDVVPTITLSRLELGEGSALALSSSQAGGTLRVAAQTIECRGASALTAPAGITMNFSRLDFRGEERHTLTYDGRWAVPDGTLVVSLPREWINQGSFVLARFGTNYAASDNAPAITAITGILLVDEDGTPFVREDVSLVFTPDGSLRLRCADQTLLILR